MQLSPINAPATGLGPQNPIGVTTFGTMRIGHALNGIAYTEHRLTAPVTKPFGQYTGSLQDAISAVQLATRTQEAQGHSRVAVALLGLPGSWTAHALSPDAAITSAIDFGPGTGGIASISFPTVSRSLAALVTSQGSLLPSQLR
jgi:hypothetical protein